MRILVCGGRDYTDKDKMEEILYPICKFVLQVQEVVIVEGGAKGADRLARDWAKSWELPVETYEADWDKHGKAAGIFRNIDMLNKGQPDLVIAFPGGAGTAHMVAIARKKGVKVIDVAKEGRIKRTMEGLANR